MRQVLQVLIVSLETPHFVVMKQVPFRPAGRTRHRLAELPDGGEKKPYDRGRIGGKVKREWEK
jgi:hypothetical protein